MGVRLPGIGNVGRVMSAGRIRAVMPTAQAGWDYVDATRRSGRRVHVATPPPSARGRRGLLTGGARGCNRQPRVRVGRVYDERTARDGTRVLVDRLWPRGLTKNRADLDEWCKQIAPSAALRRWYGHDPDRFTEFARRYRLELDDPERAEHLQHLRELARRQTLTLLTATRHVDTSEAAVLADLLDPEARTG